MANLLYSTLTCMARYGYIQTPSPSPMAPLSKPRKRRGLFLWILLGAIALCAMLGILYYTSGTALPEDPEAYDPETLTVKTKTGILHKIRTLVFHDTIPETSLNGFTEDRINVLILGVGGPGHNGPYLSDTIIVASIKPSTQQIAFFSIPRDTQVTIPGAGIKKINYANAYGEMKKVGTGGTVASVVISDTFGIPIHYYITVDFTAFEDIIDRVGGVTIQVDKTFTDPLFPAQNDTYQTVSFAAGTQLMDGKTALFFARSRHGGNGEGSDFARSKRQQKVILALKEKILGFDALSHPVQMYQMMKSVSEHTQTNLSFGDIISFTRLAKTLDTRNVITIPLDDSPQSYLTNTTGADGAFYLTFKTGGKDAVRKAIADIFSQTTPSATNISAPEQDAPKPLPAYIEIQNGTWQVGLAARLKETLAQKGYTVSTLGNTKEKPIQKSGMFAVSPRAPITVLHTLAKETRIPVLEHPATSTLYASSTDILIILGDDWVISSP
jgi:polyisoprenyl-teichoic acid--peptidoglycan teichoic acid transferase